MDVNIMIHCKQTEQNLTTKFHYHGQKHSNSFTNFSTFNDSQIKIIHLELSHILGKLSH